MLLNIRERNPGLSANRPSNNWAQGKKPRKWNVIKDWFLKNLSKSQVLVSVLVAHSFWVICRNVSRTFVELCMETPYWCTVLVHQYGRRKSTKTSGVHFFYKKLFLFTRELVYVRINISSNIWNGYTAENQEERLLSTRQHFYFGVTHCENLEVQIAVFWNETCYGNGNLYKDFRFVYLQPSANKNS